MRYMFIIALVAGAFCCIHRALPADNLNAPALLQESSRSGFQ